MKTNLLGAPAPQLSQFLSSLGEKPYRAQQLLRWMHHFGEQDFYAMSDLSKPLREKLNEVAYIAGPQVKSTDISADGTRKWLFEVAPGNIIETVYIPEVSPAQLDEIGESQKESRLADSSGRPAGYRGTLCISSQVGCALACTFCSTGRQGFNRNLSSAEIIGQLWLANKTLRESRNDRPITNVVMMGMGEPLLNFEAVVSAMQLMLDDSAYGLSRRRVTLSTSGVVPAMDRLGERCPVALAVSLHAPNDLLRDELVPINKKYPLTELLAACRRYLDHAPRDFITFEYVMLDHINDTPQHARELVKLIDDLPCKFNLIPFNPFPQSGYERSSSDAIRRFRDILMAAGLIVTIRKTRGDDIDAACGQLAGRVQDKSRRLSKRTPVAL